MNILVVCSANTCRSPMAAALLAPRLKRALVVSAGFQAGGAPATPETTAVMSAYGVALTSHRSTCLKPETLGLFDLVLTMTRGHTQQIAEVVPEALPRTFTLREFVTRGEAVGVQRQGQALERWLDKVGAGRTALLYLGDDADVADPFGGDLASYQSCASTLDALTRSVAHLLSGGAPPEHG